MFSEGERRRQSSKKQNIMYSLVYISYVLCYRSTNKGAIINPAKCRIINLGLLNKHTNNVAQHIATCQPCIDKAISSQECTFISGEKNHCLAISSKRSGCGEVIPFSTSTKLTDRWWPTLDQQLCSSVGPDGSRCWIQSPPRVNECTWCSYYVQELIHSHRMCSRKMVVGYVGGINKAAGEEERRIAIQKNSYHKQVPAITVIVDGGWSKWANRHSYNALSGVGVIFGKETGKLLYMGVRKVLHACTKTSKQVKKIIPASKIGVVHQHQWKVTSYWKVFR